MVYLNTVIDTYPGNALRITSTYEYKDDGMKWVTYLWEHNEVVNEYRSVNNVNEVIELHYEINDKLNKEDD